MKDNYKERKNSKGILKKTLIFLSAIFCITLVIAGTTYFNTSSAFVANQTQTLSPIGEGITSSEVKVNNDTWLDFNNTNEDYVLITSDITESITFWYKNSTTDWIFVVNSSGVLYNNAIQEVPAKFPAYYNGSAYFLGKENATTFFNGSIDDFRVYNLSLKSNEIDEIYSGGRL